MYTDGSKVVREQQGHLHKPYGCAAVGTISAQQLLQARRRPVAAVKATSDFSEASVAV
jgi:hypothetical protein